MIYHVTIVTYIFIIQEIKLKKRNKKKRKSNIKYKSSSILL